MSESTVDVSTFLVGKLREGLQKLNLSVKGIKADLVARLRAANDADSSSTELTAEEQVNVDNIERLRLEKKSRDKAENEILVDRSETEIIPKRRKIIKEIGILNVFVERSEVLQKLLNHSVAVGNDV
jgi:hypothetical protein